MAQREHEMGMQGFGDSVFGELENWRISGLNK
jgi:hypothetical protein